MIVIAFYEVIVGLDRKKSDGKFDFVLGFGNVANFLYGEFFGDSGETVGDGVSFTFYVFDEEVVLHEFDGPSGEVRMSRLFLEEIDEGTVISVDDDFCSIDVRDKVTKGEDNCTEFELDRRPFSFGGGAYSGPISYYAVSFATSYIFVVDLHKRSAH